MGFLNDRSDIQKDTHHETGHAQGRSKDNGPMENPKEFGLVGVSSFKGRCDKTKGIIGIVQLQGNGRNGKGKRQNQNSNMTIPFELISDGLFSPSPSHREKKIHCQRRIVEGNANASQIDKKARSDTGLGGGGKQGICFIGPSANEKPNATHEIIE